MSAAPPPPESRRMRITGLHHVTVIVGDLERTVAFYRDTLGLALVQQGANDDDPGARHFWFGDAGGAPGTLLSFLEYPQMADGIEGRGAAHHIALAVDSVEELDAWKAYLESRDVPCSEVFQRGRFRSIYLRDPDGTLLEIATR